MNVLGYTQYFYRRTVQQFTTEVNFEFNGPFTTYVNFEFNKFMNSFLFNAIFSKCMGLNMEKYIRILMEVILIIYYMYPNMQYTMTFKLMFYS